MSAPRQTPIRSASSCAIIYWSPCWRSRLLAGKSPDFRRLPSFTIRCSIVHPMSFFCALPYRLYAPIAVAASFLGCGQHDRSPLHRHQARADHRTLATQARNVSKGSKLPGAATETQTIGLIVPAATPAGFSSSLATKPRRSLSTRRFCSSLPRSNSLPAPTRSRLGPCRPIGSSFPGAPLRFATIQIAADGKPWSFRSSHCRKVAGHKKRHSEIRPRQRQPLAKPIESQADHRRRSANNHQIAENRRP